MPKKLLNLYIRAVGGAARLPFTVAARSTKLAFDTAEAAYGLVRGGAGEHDSREPAPPPATSTPTPTPTREAIVEPEAEPAPAEPEPLPQAPVIDYDAEPMTPIGQAEVAKTIDDEDELVAEFADPGAEDGPGPTIEVEPPWDGYGVMHADDVAARIAAADEAELFVLELYERAHKNRRTVIEAAEGRLRELANLPRRA
jgi:hypothetical protein